MESGRAAAGDRYVAVYDTTLRDGTQQVGMSLSLQDKLELLQRAAAFGVDYVEGGWPGSNPKDLEFFRAARRLTLPTRLVAFGSTRRAGVAVEDDPGVQALLAAGTPAVAVVGKSWGLHVRDALATSRDENLAMIGDTVAALKAHGLEVLFDAEHFFDGCAEDPAYALETVRAAAAAGADWLVLCDTNGGSLPEHVAHWTAQAVAALGRPVGIHTHDDAGLAVANALAAVAAGARQVQGTWNGYGERCGNANLCTLLPNLVLKAGYRCRPGGQLAGLTALSHVVSEICNLPPAPGAPYVGPNAFAHKGGVHVSAVTRNSRTYEHVPPEAVGNSRTVVVSELAGRSNLAYKFRELGLGGLADGERQRLLERVKQLEFEGYQFEAAEASFELLVRRTLPGYRPFFEPLRYSVSVWRGTGPESQVEATVRVVVGGEVFHTAADGDGPVNALDRALRKALHGPYPELAEMHLSDYKVRVIDGREGTASRVRVLISTEAPDGRWTTVGVSHNILDASWQGLVDSVEYGLWRRRNRLQGAEAPGVAAGAS
jgi:2-isopropylmalate synthase